MSDNNARYRRFDLPVEDRVKNLLSHMTVEEKARQLDMYHGEELVDKMQSYTVMAEDAVFDTAKAEALLGDVGVGSIHDLYPRSAEIANTIQKWLRDNSRLGIPALFVEEGLHGICAPGHTIFPQSIALASTWNPDIARETGAAIAAEMRAVNVHLSLSPVLDLPRDFRWGRTEETFGESPYLIGRIGADYVKGMQGESLATDHTIVAEPKHFAAHGAPEAGLNQSPVHVGKRELHTMYLPGFKAAFVEGGAMGAMCAYHEIDGVPCAADEELLTKILREEWGFEGIVISDLGAIGLIEKKHFVAKDAADAIRQALTAGIDMQFYDYPHDVFQGSIAQSVKDGLLPMEILDRAVSRVLALKFRLGLFDEPFIDPRLKSKVNMCQAHVDLALRSAREAICLLKNDGLLPLRKDLKKIAVIGPNADAVCLGDYVQVGERKIETIREAISEVLGTGAVAYASGEDISKAVEAAYDADAAIVALGESDKTCGEGVDRASLDLPDDQFDLLKAIYETGTPVALVLQNGRPLSITWAAENVPAIVEAWYVGEVGAKAIAEVLFGDYNPAGRLPVTFPKSVGQLPIYHNPNPSLQGKYVEIDHAPLYPFGFGLSYTTFSYGNLTISPAEVGVNGSVTISVDVRNTGSRAGDEVVQLYVRDLVSSVCAPVQSLKGFQRIHLKAGESRKVTFELATSELALLDRSFKWVVEPGTFEVLVGGSSADGLKATFEVA